MKRTMRKDLLRAITKSMGRFLSIFLIVALGCGFFAGIRATGQDMRETADKYYDTNQLMDIHLISELGFSEENVDAIAGTDGVSKVMPSYQTTLSTRNEGEGQIFRVQSISAGKDRAELNQLMIIDGRLPQNSSECVIDQRAAKNESYGIGQTVELENSAEKESSILAFTTFTIVGTVDSPLYVSFSWAASTLGSEEPDFNIFVLPDAFSSDIYTDIYITVSGADAFASYGDEYKDRVKEVLSAVKATGAEQSEIRRDEVLNQKMDEFSQVPAGDEDQTAAAQTALEEVTNTWYYLDRTAGAGYATFEDDSARIDAIATVFPTFFLAVAALVSLTAMTRMVDEERTQIGSLKALGYSRRSIAMKYTSYAALASALGGLCGLLIGFQLFPRVIFGAYLILYRLPAIDPPFRWGLAWITLTIAVLGTSVAALFAILASLRSAPATLMRPKAPKIGKRVLLENIPFIWNHMNFTKKVTARNLLRYKKRFFMTVIGIAGCTALILAGFGLKNSVTGIVEKQYGEIMLYDLQIVLKNAVDDPAQDETFTWLRNSSEIESLIPISAQTAEVVSEKASSPFEVSLLIPQDAEEFLSYVSLHKRIGKEMLSLTDDGVIITEKLARLKSVGVGDQITLEGIGDANTEVTVLGVCENYTYHYVYMTQVLYGKLYGEKAPVNAAFAQLTDTSEEAIGNYKEKIKDQPNIAGTIFVPLMKGELDNIFGSLDYVIAVLILSAFALAVVVLYNLTNININERVREIATIKVLGFYDMEVSAYVFRENAIITLLGAGLGLGLGVLLHRFVISTAEIDMIMFGRDIYLNSYFISFALTVFFSLLVNLVMHFYLRKISMVESLKSVE